MKLRWVYLDKIEPSLGIATWEYSRIIDIDKPTVLGFRFNKDGVDVGNLNPYEYYINLDKIPSHYSLQRYYAPTPTKFNVGSAIWNSDMIWCNYHFPKTFNLQEMMRHIKLSTVKTLRHNGISSILKGNDIVLLKDKERKFSGYMYEDWDKSYVINQFISFRLNYDDMELILRKDINKFTKKGKSNIKDITCGLSEYNKDLNIYNIHKEIIETLSRRLDLDLYEDSLTNNENNELNKLSKGLDTDDWKYKCIHPNLGDVMIK